MSTQSLPAGAAPDSPIGNTEMVGRFCLTLLLLNLIVYLALTVPAVKSIFAHEWRSVANVAVAVLCSIFGARISGGKTIPFWPMVIQTFLLGSIVPLGLSNVAGIDPLSAAPMFVLGAGLTALLESDAFNAERCADTGLQARRWRLTECHGDERCTHRMVLRRTLVHGECKTCVEERVILTQLQQPRTAAERGVASVGEGGVATPDDPVERCNGCKEPYHRSEYMDGYCPGAECKLSENNHRGLIAKRSSPRDVQGGST